MTSALVLLLSERERRILVLLARSYTAREIGTDLGIALGTTKGAINILYARIGVNSKLEAVLWAIRNGVVSQ